jgi:dihydrofolate reductase
MHVVLFAAQSVDGWITRHDEAGDAFTSEADKRHFRAAIRACDACVMGRTTYELSKSRMRPEAFPSLRRVVWTRNPAALSSEAVPGIIEFTDETPPATARRLARDGRQRCAVLGGGATNAAWLAAGLVDEICLTVESQLFGYGTPLLGPPDRLDFALELLEVLSLEQKGPVVLRYRVLK